MKIVPLLKKIDVQLLVTSLLVLGTFLPAWAQPYTAPSGLGAPARRESAGTRGCVFGNPNAVFALSPQNGVGWTADPYPRFYWYLPINRAALVEFTLQQVPDGTADPIMVYQTRFAVTGEKGIMSLQLPEDASIPPLVAGDRYQWQVAVFCNANSRNGELQVDGWVEYQTPDAELTAAIAAATPADQIALYASHGYWFDALDQLVMLQTTHPNDADLQAQWTEFLESVGLGTLAAEPIISVEAAR